MFAPIFRVKKGTALFTRVRTAGSRFRRGLLAPGMMILAAGVCAGQEPAPDSGQVPSVAYVSEVPYQWQGALGNPLELWARKLGSEWAASRTDGITERLGNLRPELSWERLEKTARTGKAQAFVVHGYEFVEHGNSAQLDALLVPSRDGKAAMTEFVILRRKQPDGPADRKFTTLDFEDREILVDRGGCGELVYRWLDREIRLETGNSSRDHLAEFHTASSAAEAVLAVYFGDSYACVVSRADFQEVTRYNPRGIDSKLEVVRHSDPYLQHVIACPKRMIPSRRQELVQGAAGVSLQQTDGEWKLAVPGPGDFRTVAALMAQWQEFFGGKQEPGLRRTVPAAVPAVVPAAESAAPALPPAVPAPSVTGRRRE